MNAVFQDTALVLLGHGTEMNANSAEAARLHVRAISERRLFSSVREAYWKQEPRPAGVLASLRERRVVIVPFFLSEGYFTGVVIPQALGLEELSRHPGIRVRDHGSQQLCYSPALGGDPQICEYILQRARGVVRQFPFPRAPRPVETSLFLAGHGTERSRQSRAAVDEHAATIRQMGEYASVEVVFLEQEPRVPQVYSMALSRNIVVVPFFTSDGLHTREDIPELLGEPRQSIRERLAAGTSPWRNPTEKHGKLVWCSNALGSEPGVTDLVITRAITAMRAAWGIGPAPGPISS